ncbi:MAG: bifunctional 3-phenylpropionate/cinnamic acid dioxygenase ferredoxin subunit [Advenella sp.]|jgi:3-phenylpropionate/trans-cinnamate dioxygenase ferredoxin subunit|uniref:Bifunctional 3-phenylpropionate/cinnamic acid dioxygenase ferredoxin subunit n=1 Tax=Advenella alkanexedens TaxID=1481665 RepID=A0ABS6NN54_9BURK|nr:MULTISPECIES: 3-phenylpropionate/cinnamic acid dioxygenase ferredoxin subunit [Advenella]MBV4396799.1 bifunctional 3-phenylpropionate/cinnamic acid dioxygenase ferredoxin subunit [Advenella alkanexedens]MDD3758711.1 bifunctional 3-phenylpropionate/cinnamic acid dioxygenase ferredoxin subunit [Advenella sp.]MDY0271425.1 bifunctional 3-phenylpropionate/cinnamic acid dioxygenase ferredoxin subunit [Advenella sp.]NLN68739.1 bifunctional 3-phenylpropionate/cinnamic acid dioxygenase ferredoxin sub
MEKIFVCSKNDLPEGEAIKVDCQPEAIAVFNIGGSFHAMNDKCSHGNASMSEGYIEEDGTVECPLHSALFCVKTGKPLCLPATDPIATHPVVVENDSIYVLLKEQQQ